MGDGRFLLGMGGENIIKRHLKINKYAIKIHMVNIIHCITST